VITNGSVYLVNSRNCKLLSKKKLLKRLQARTCGFSTIGRVTAALKREIGFAGRNCDHIFPIPALLTDFTPEKWITGCSLWKYINVGSKFPH